MLVSIILAPARKKGPEKAPGLGNPWDVFRPIFPSSSLYTQHPEKSFGQKQWDREWEPLAPFIWAIITRFLTEGFSLLGHIKQGL